ncbi:alpha-2-macroglobulin [Aquimarina sp. W85]|uniref:alpha-2-macroglobulin family protein n=1 Tax=Aquimarina rhodophyticola TaxID=3342246 RepID=UPI00366AB3B3
MKRYIILAFIISITNLMAQDFYVTEWNKVAEFEKKGLPKSASEVVNTIYDQAKKNQNTSQLIKALLHKSKYSLTLEENAQLKIIQSFKKEIDQTNSPEKQVLQNMLANLYWQYFQQNRWKFYNRTKTASKPDTTDFRTWDLQTLFNEVHTLFQRSLKNPKILQETAIETLDDILITQTNSKNYRPTIYDLLAHQALEFYKTSETNITKPAYAFKIDDKDYLADFTTFKNLKLKSKDSVSLQLHALQLYQNLIRFHAEDKDPAALIDVTIDRLLFVKQYTTVPNAQTILLATLKKEREYFRTNPLSTLYAYQIALILQEQASTYVPSENELHQFKLEDALEVCNAAIAEFPKSRGAKNCAALKSRILAPQLQVTTETTIPVLQTSRVLVTYKNIKDLHFKALRITAEQLLTLEKSYKIEEKINLINALPSQVTWKATTCSDRDYQTHTTEVVVPELPRGNFLIIASTTPKISLSSLLAYGDLQVTNLAIVEHHSPDADYFQVIDRMSGSPIENATIQLTTSKNSGNRTPLNTSLTTDTKGMAKLPIDGSYYNVEVIVVYKEDTARFKGYYINRRPNAAPSSYRQTFTTYLFTDRGIYRPGQTVFFKGILVSSQQNNTATVVAAKKVTATLRDINGQELQSLNFETNDFGSFHGQFVLPASGLTGVYMIQMDSHHNTSFAVEAYKRPKFETQFNPVTETYNVNDTVSLSGTATAYAGSSITNAKVVYRVYRNVNYPYWYYWSRPAYRSEAQEIKHGETTTNAKGVYTINFPAIPDTNIDKNQQAVFNYQVIAEITDISGETRVATTTVNVGYHAIVMTLDNNKHVRTDQKTDTLKIITKNLNNEYIATTGTFTIHKLIAPTQPLRKRTWSSPDCKTLDQEAFKKLFPHDAYNQEDDYHQWKNGAQVFKTNFDTRESANSIKGVKPIILSKFLNWKTGTYRIEAFVKDKNKQDVKAISYITVDDPKATTVADQKLFTISLDKSIYKIGDIAQLRIGSAANDLKVTLIVEKDRKVVDTQIITVSNEIKRITLPITKEDLGGFAITYSYTKFNAFETGNLMVSVPYPASDLQISTKTFRDKLQPGQEETWSFTIKGPKGEKVTAELLASLYDMSLDQFKPHQWQFSPYVRPTYYPVYRLQSRQSFGVSSLRVHQPDRGLQGYHTQQYDRLNWFGLSFGNYYPQNRILQKSAMPMRKNEIMAAPNNLVEEEMAGDIASLTNSDTTDTTPDNDKNIPNQATKEQKAVSMIREHLQETAFFFPQLTTDASGNVSFSFTTPEALTQWKLQLLAHTKELQSAVTSLETVTQKELMVLPNPPRFLRIGDTIRFGTKIANVSNQTLTGTAKLQLTDAFTNREINNELSLQNSQQPFTVAKDGNAVVFWELIIPQNIQTVQYTITATAGDFSDGEQNVIPVLDNRMLVTETLPMWVRSGQTKIFTLDKLKNSTSTTLSHHKLSLEMTSNPAWYAVQALPYLMEYPYECSEQTFSRYYANALAQHITQSNPRIEQVFKQWKTSDALISNLEKNQELKSLILEETPWVRDAASEREQKKRIALLFDANMMRQSLETSLNKLLQMQHPSGAFPWFEGGRANRYITQHIITGFGHLQQLGVTTPSTISQTMLQKALQYLDQEFVKEYQELKRYTKEDKEAMAKNHLSYTQIHYLYMRSFFKDSKPSRTVTEATSYYMAQAQKYWLDQNLYAQGMLALITHRAQQSATAKAIIKSLDERSIKSDELGMYWKSNTSSWYWYQAPIETQALLIEAFAEITEEPKRTEYLDNLKIWLLKHKQTNRWATTKATTQAIYALLLQGSDWLSITETVAVKVGSQTIDPSTLEATKIEAGTGYFKTTWSGKEITPQQGNVTITKKEKGIAWGALYWQYFEDLDKITTAETPLKLKKSLYLKKNTDTGEQITQIDQNTNLQLGDLVRVRIELRTDRDMEFVHMKDMRASGLEPVNVLSSYKYQDGLGYYESTKDAATNFFFDYLRKGVYVFEYDVRVNNEGYFSNGITTIQSMYAPEFSSHSEGIRIQIGE